MSTNFYAELSDPSGKILQRVAYPITESTAAGNFDLPKEMGSDYLHIRAYTTWMTNFDTAFYYERNIGIIHAKPEPALPATEGAMETTLRFFPEGGDRVSGLESVVAFNATDGSGMPVPVSGVIVDGTGKPLLNFASEHDGMGALLLPDDAGDSLTAVWKDDRGLERRTPLPHGRETGVVFRAMPANHVIFFSVARSDAGGPALNHLTIIGHMHQYMVCRAQIDLTGQVRNSGGIPTGKLPSGVLVLTVFDANRTPVAERAVFIDNHDYLFQPDLTVRTIGITRRGKNTLLIDIPDTIRTNLSVSVTDATADGELSDEDNIVSHLLLTGDVRGYVHDPYFYFSNGSDSLAHLLDLVMLTHGWRRINWEALEQGQVPVIRNPRQDYLALQADVTGVPAGKIGQDESLNVIMRGADSSIRLVEVPHVGGLKFGIMGLVFYDTVTVAYQFNKKHALDRKAVVTFHTGLVPAPAVVRPLIPGLKGLPDDTTAFSRNQYIQRQQAREDAGNKLTAPLLAPAVVTAKEKSTIEKMDQRYTSGIFSGGIMALQYDLVDDRQALSYTSVFQYLEGRVPGLIVNFRPPGGYVLSWRGDAPQIFLDEQPVSIEMAGEIPISNIAYVKAFRPGTEVGFSTGYGGSIAIYTKKG
ncbi:MAG TPA: hypothetical protein VGR89_03215, partial [Puia sp.]|nr:hypothetical protein [Puia sp.]